MGISAPSRNVIQAIINSQVNICVIPYAGIVNNGYLQVFEKTVNLTDVEKLIIGGYYGNGGAQDTKVKVTLGASIIYLDSARNEWSGSYNIDVPSGKRRANVTLRVYLDSQSGADLGYIHSWAICPMETLSG
jgi:hypothetical protein